MNFGRLISSRAGMMLAGVAAPSAILSTSDRKDSVLSAREGGRSKEEFENNIPILKNEPFTKKQHQQRDIQREAVSAGAVNNPAVFVGLGLTCIALIGMMRKSYSGDRIGAQRFMQYRIYAQFFTIFALIAGVSYYSFKLQKQEDREEKEREDANKKQ